MRTTVNIDDDVLMAAKERARRERRSTGEVLSELARRGLTAPASSSSGPESESLFGFRPIPRRTDAIVTNELIDRLRADGPY